MNCCENLITMSSLNILNIDNKNVMHLVFFLVSHSAAV